MILELVSNIIYQFVNIFTIDYINCSTRNKATSIPKSGDNRASYC